MTDKAVTYEEVVEVVAKATAMYYAHNRMPVMSGNPLDRLHPSLKRDCYDGARAALSAIRKAGVVMVQKSDLEDVLELAEKPTYNALEVGFRHHPLTEKEAIERFHDTCQQIVLYVTAMLTAGEIKPQETEEASNGDLST